MFSRPDFDSKMKSIGSQAEVFEILATIEARWGIEYQNERVMYIDDVFTMIKTMFLSNERDSQDDVVRRIEDAVFEIGVIMRTLHGMNAMDDLVNNRCDRVCELLYYAELVSKGVKRMQIASKTSYTPLMNNEVGITRFRSMICDELNPQQQLILTTLNKLSIHNLRKCDDKVMQAVYTKDGHYTNAWKEKCTIVEYVRDGITPEVHYEQWCLLTSGNDIDEKVAKYLMNNKNHQFPEVRKNRNVFAFSNGIYHIDARENGQWVDKFYSYTDPVPGDLVACKFTDAPLEFYDSDDPAKIPTPYLDSVLQFQKFIPEEIEVLYVMIGRMLFDIKEHDNWQVMLFFLGLGGTGKSTIINHVLKALYDLEDIGIIANNTEQQFGLGPLKDKFIILAPEIKSDFKLEQGQFQSMVTGDGMSISEKHKSAKTIYAWTPQCAFAGNQTPNWDDNGGSVQRRMLVFRFDQFVKDGDMFLGEKIEKEYPNILVKAVKSYMRFAEKNGAKNIWTVLPKKFIESREELACSTNPLEAFLLSDDVKKGEHYYCERNDFLYHFRKFADVMKKPFPWKKETYSGPFQTHNVTMHKALREWPLGSGVMKNVNYMFGVQVLATVPVNTMEIKFIDEQKDL